MAFGKGPWRGLSGRCGQLLEQQFPCPVPCQPWLLVEQGLEPGEGHGKVPAA